MARAYMTDINKFRIGETYELVEEPGVLFKITYFNGVFAWDISKMIMKRLAYQFPYCKK